MNRDLNDNEIYFQFLCHHFMGFSVNKNFVLCDNRNFVYSLNFILWHWPRLNWLSTQFYLQTSSEFRSYTLIISTTWFCFNIISRLYINSPYLKLKMSFNNVCNKYGCHRWSKLGNIPAFIQNSKIENVLEIRCWRV